MYNTSIALYRFNPRFALRKMSSVIQTSPIRYVETVSSDKRIECGAECTVIKRKALDLRNVRTHTLRALGNQVQGMQ